MRSVSRILISALWLTGSVAGVRAQTPAPAEAAGAAGHWQGTISMPDGDVGFTVDLSRKSGGAWIGSLTITGATAIDVPLTEIVVDGATAKFHAGLVESPNFAGTLLADGNNLAGDVSNVRGAVPFQLKRNGAAKVSVPPPSTPFGKAKDIEGAWDGTLTAPAMTMHVVLRIFADADGATTATLVNLDRGNVPVPMTTVTWSELRLVSRAVSGSFAGKLTADGAIAGEWTQGPQKLPLTFKRP